MDRRPVVAPTFLTAVSGIFDVRRGRGGPFGMLPRPTDPLTDRARLRLGLLLSSRAFTVSADDGLRAGKLGRLSLVELFERDLVRLLFVPTFPRPSECRAAGRIPGRTSSAHAKHLRQDIVEVDLGARALAAPRIEGGHAMRIIQMSLLIIKEDLVCLADRLESNLRLGSLGLGYFIRVTGQGCLVTS